MSDKTVEPEGSIEISAEKYGAPASVSIYFVFDGDWCNMYDDEPDNEEQARAWFIEEVQSLLEARRNAARNKQTAEGPSDTENRGT